MSRQPANGDNSFSSRHGLKGESPLVRARIAAAASFIKRSSISGFDVLNSIDFNADVREMTLDPGFHLIAFRAGPLPGAVSWNPFGLLYSEVGNSPHEVGIKPDKRLFLRYIVATAVRVLRFRPTAPGGSGGGAGSGGRSAKGRAITAPRYLAGGFGWQYIIPDANTVLRRI